MIHDLQTTNQSFRSFRPFTFETETSTDDLDVLKSCSKTFDVVRDIVAESVDCHVQNQVEMGWNNLVHTPLLKTALVYGRPLSGLRLAPWYAHPFYSMSTSLTEML